MMKYIVGNWKMYPTAYDDALLLVKGVRPIAAKAVTAGVQPIVCPPMPFLAGVTKQKRVSANDKAFEVGAQNCASAHDGAMTGEASPAQLKSMGINYVILGHSERRAVDGFAKESDEVIATKVVAAIAEKLTVILCVGERERDASGEYFKEISEQLAASLDGFPVAKSGQLIIAYEPVWAIGSKATGVATPEDFREVEMLLRRELAAHLGKVRAFKIPILYGGSVSKENAQSFLNIGADGLLIGRTSLDTNAFVSIIKGAMQHK